MGIQNQLLLICSIGALAGLLVLATSRSCSADDGGAEAEEIQMPINRSNFPPGFIFGAGTSAYAVSLYPFTVHALLYVVNIGEIEILQN